MTDRKEWPASPFVAQVVKDPNSPADAVMLTGFLGASPAEGSTRLYLNVDLSEYVDLPDEAILHAERSGEESPIAPTYVWVRKDVAFAGAQSAGAEFLQGSLVDTLMADARAGAQAGAPVGGGLFTRIPAACPPPPPPPPWTQVPAVCMQSMAPAFCPPSHFGPCVSMHAPCQQGLLPQGGLNTKHPLICHTRPPRCVPDTVNPPCIPETAVNCHVTQVGCWPR